MKIILQMQLTYKGYWMVREDVNFMFEWQEHKIYKERDLASIAVVSQVN